MTPGATDQIILMLVSGVSEETIRDIARTKLEIAQRKVAKVIADCRTKITLAASYARDEEIGKSITRLNDCYTKAAQIQDVKTCVQVQRELNKLMGLYHAAADPHPNDDTDHVSEAEKQARAHLAPLFDGGDSLPLAELARLAAQRIVGA